MPASTTNPGIIFTGMSEKEIEHFRVEALTGHRPTWPLGKRRREDAQRRMASISTMPSAYSAKMARAPTPRPPERRLTRLQLQLWRSLNLEETATLQEIKARYKELVKRFHPDANGGDRGAEERLKQVIKAYGVLRAAGLT